MTEEAKIVVIAGIVIEIEIGIENGIVAMTGSVIMVVTETAIMVEIVTNIEITKIETEKEIVTDLGIVIVIERKKTALAHALGQTRRRRTVRENVLMIQRVWNETPKKEGQ
jgi:hypothetical protein